MYDSGHEDEQLEPSADQMTMELLRDYKNKKSRLAKKRYHRRLQGRRKCRFGLFTLAAAFVFVSGILVGYFTNPRGCSKDGAEPVMKKPRDILDTLVHELKADELNHTLRYFSRKPHGSGSRRQKELADEISRRWEEYGLQVDMPEYDVLLSMPDDENPDYIRVVDGEGNETLRHTFVTQAKADPGDNKMWNISSYYRYSPRGTVQGGLLYVNKARPEDFKYLSKINISCDGAIVILKEVTGFHFNLRNQLKNAQKYNASAALVFKDQHSNASFAAGQDAYPVTDRLPKESPVASSLYSDIGDPLTPLLPATNGTYRLSMKEANLKVKIPVQLVEYAVARKLLSMLRGTEMPNQWKPTQDQDKDYRLGPILAQNSTISLTVNTDTKRHKIYNVIGTVYGKEEPDHWVLIGNHRDAIVFGGVDAGSGTTALMELSRGMGELLKQGWQPRRTIKFCSWGAEEDGLIGSTEWVEEHVKLMQERAVTYINMDTLVRGNYTLYAKGNPMLAEFVFSQTKLVPAPYSLGDSMYSLWIKRDRSQETGLPEFRTSAISSDYQPFYEFAGVPCLDLQYVSKDGWYEAYHTPFDTYHWMRLIDPRFQVVLAQTRLAARLLFQLSDSHLLPFNVTKLSISLEQVLDRTKQRTKCDEAKMKQNNITLDYMTEEATKFRETTEEFENTKKLVDSEILKAPERDRLIRLLNRRMVILNKMFVSSEGIPNEPSIRNRLHGLTVNTNYPNASFVGIADAIVEAKRSGSWNDVKHQISVTHHCITQARQTLHMPLVH